MPRIFIGLALVLVALPAWAQTRDENRTKCLSNNPDISISGCTADIQSGQESTLDLSVTYLNRGNAYEDKDLYDQAIADYTKAITLAPNYALAYANRGITYDLKGLYDQALADENKAITLKPDYAWAYTNRGVVYKDKGLYDQAIADQTKAIKLKPDYALAYLNRGFAYGFKGLFDQVVADETKAITLKPDYVSAYNIRGGAYERKGLRDKAITDYRMVLRLIPDKNTDMYKDTLGKLKRLGAAPGQNLGSIGAGKLHFSYEYRQGQFLRRATGTVKDTRGLWNALAALQPPPGAHGGYGLIGDDSLLGKEPGYGLRQLGLVTRRYVTFNILRVEQPSGWEQIGVQSGTFTNVDQLNDTTLGWVFFDLRPKFEVDLKSRLP